VKQIKQTGPPISPKDQLYLFRNISYNEQFCLHFDRMGLYPQKVKLIPRHHLEKHKAEYTFSEDGSVFHKKSRKHIPKNKPTYSLVFCGTKPCGTPYDVHFCAKKFL
jgi:hypothetical protein